MTLSDAPVTDVRWNLDDLYEGMDDPRIDETLDALQVRAAQFEADYKGKIDAPDLTAATLSAAIRDYEKIWQDARKPSVFASLLFSTDTSDPARGAFLQKIRERSTRLSIPLIFFDLELAALPDVTLSPLLDDPLVSPYRHFLETTRLYREHMLTETEERLLEETANTGARAFGRLFSEITANAVFKVGEEELTQSEIIARLSSPERDVRREAAAAFSVGLEKDVKTIAYIHNTLLQDKNVKDRLRRYDSPESSRHLANELPPETVALVVETVVKNYPLVARYYHLKREILGVETLTHFDRYAPLFSSDETVNFDAARLMVLEAFGAFSEELLTRAGEFFDKRWIDAASVKGKQGGAYCMSVTPDFHPFVFLNYLGRMQDVMTLAHELGHGVHASLARQQTLLNFSGTLPLAELASTFGEMLVFERVQSEASLKDKLALYAEKIEGAFATIPRQTAMYRFEQAIHARRRESGELTVDDFGDAWQREVQLMFGDSVTLGDEHRVWWSYIGHFIGSPFYVYAYSFGELLALSLYGKSRREGPAFAEKYLDLLRAGGSLTPQELVKKVDADLDAPNFWQGGFDVLTGLVERFEALWKEYQVAHE